MHSSYYRLICITLNSGSKFNKQFILLGKLIVNDVFMALTKAFDLAMAWIGYLEDSYSFTNNHIYLQRPVVTPTWIGLTSNLITKLTGKKMSIIFHSARQFKLQKTISCTSTSPFTWKCYQFSRSKMANGIENQNHGTKILFCLLSQAHPSLSIKVHDE